MPEWTFTLRLVLADSSRILFDDQSVVLALGARVGDLWLSAGQSPIKDAASLTFTGGADSQAEAAARAAIVIDALQLAFARFRIAADFGRATLDDRFTSHEHHLPGISIYPTERGTRHIRGPLRPTVGSAIEGLQLTRAISAALAHDPKLTEREHIAYDLFAASIFERSAEVRLLSLVMAIETLIDQKERDSSVQAHVKALIDTTKQADLPSADERQSLLSSLGWLLRESISGAGRRLVKEKLGDRIIGATAAIDLWTTAYELRHKLVHGRGRRPSRLEVGTCAANLELMVGYLLSGALLDIDI